MRCLIQRSLESNVEVNGNVIGSINKGLVVLVGFTDTDTLKDIDYMVNKILNIRIFDDEDGVMNKSLLDVNGELLVVSQFTLYADASKGRRPSYVKALSSDKAIPLYELFISKLKENNIKVETGEFGADMKVSITNDGPVTIWVESRE